MSGFWNWATQLLFPPRCIFCGEVVRAGESGCGTCIGGLSRMCGALCTVCGKDRRDCVCTAEPFCFVRCIAPFAYDGRVKRGILELKRSARTPATGFFAREMAQAVRANYTNVSFSAVTYIPAADDNMRGFNQAKLLAEAVAAELSIPCITPPIKKLSGAPPQHTQSAAGRHVNARQSYVAAPGTPAGTVLLVDDVMTTGATMSRCAALLLEAGADQVYAVSAAATLRQEMKDNFVREDR